MLSAELARLAFLWTSPDRRMISPPIAPVAYSVVCPDLHDSGAGRQHCAWNLLAKANSSCILPGGLQGSLHGRRVILQKGGVWGVIRNDLIIVRPCSLPRDGRNRLICYPGRDVERRTNGTLNQ